MGNIFLFDTWSVIVNSSAKVWLAVMHIAIDLYRTLLSERFDGVLDKVIHNFCHMGLIAKYVQVVRAIDLNTDIFTAASFGQDDGFLNNILKSAFFFG